MQASSTSPPAFSWDDWYSSVCVYHHKEWAKDFEGFKTKLFPAVNMQEPPTPVDPDIHKHKYPKLNR